MASEIEEPFSLNFQLDSFRSGSISFGRYENEALCWERRSSFSHNRYLEEVEKCSKPGSVTEKKAYFEAHFRKKLVQSSPECLNDIEYHTSEIDISEKRDYSEETTTFDGAVHETEQFGNSFSEPQIELSSDITKNTEKHENEEKTEVCLKDKRDLPPKEKIPSEDKYTKPQVSVGQSRKNTSRNSSKVSENKANKTVPLKSRAEIKTSEVPSKVERGSKIKGVDEIKSVGKRLTSRTFVEPQSSTPQKVSSRVHQSANRAVGANKPGTRQDSSRFSLKSDERAQRRKELEEKMHVKKAELPQLRTKIQEKTKTEIKQLSKSLNSKTIPTSFYRGALREPAGNKDISTNTKTRKLPSTSSTLGSRVSKSSQPSARAKTSDPSQASRATSSHSTLTSDSCASSQAITSNAHPIHWRKDVEKEKLIRPNQKTTSGRNSTYTPFRNSSRTRHVALGVAS